MARPRKLGLDYFSVETTDFHSTETGAMLRRHKGDGYAVVMYLKTAIFAKGYYLPFGELEREAFYDRFPWIMKEQLEAILDDCFHLRIFDEELYRAEGVLSSARIQELYFFATEWRIRDDMDFEYLLIKLPNNDAKAHKKRSNSKKTGENTVCNKSDVSESELPENLEVAKTLGVCQSQRKGNGKETIPNQTIREENSGGDYIKKGGSAGKPALCVAPPQELAQFENAIRDSNPIPPQKARSGFNEKFMPANDNSTVIYVNSSGENCYALDDLIKRRLNAPLWLEHNCMTYSVKPAEMPQLMQEFRAHYLARMNPEVNSDKKFSAYFSNWLKVRQRYKRDEERYQQLKAEREAKIDARMAEREAKIDARMAERDAKFDARFEQQKRSQPHQFECEKNYVPRLNIIKFDKDVPAESGFDLPDFDKM
jgi:hypothetical protein